MRVGTRKQILLVIPETLPPTSHFDNFYVTFFNVNHEQLRDLPTLFDPVKHDRGAIGNVVSHDHHSLTLSIPGPAPVLRSYDLTDHNILPDVR